MIYNTTPTSTYNGITDFSALPIVELLKDRSTLVGIEIGCDKGDSSEGLLKALPKIKSLISIDPFVNYVDWNGVFENTRESVYNYAYSRLSKYNNHKIIRQTSDDYVNNVEDGSLDFIFIDGLHTYEQVLTDCRNYYSKIKKGGLFAGHDFNAIVGVRNAVQEFAKEFGMTISTSNPSIGDVWYWIK